MLITEEIFLYSQKIKDESMKTTVPITTFKNILITSGRFRKPEMIVRIASNINILLLFILIGIKKAEPLFKDSALFLTDRF